MSVRRLRRFAGLMASAAAGAAIGGLGSWLTGSDVWYLAVPAAIAIGWLAVADPTRCDPVGPRGGSDAGSPSP
jgi:hypothetical protein